MAARTRRARCRVKAREADWKTYYEKLWKPMTHQSAAMPRDNMTLAQYVTARDALRDALRKYESVTANCRSCAHFDMGHCKKFGQVPPTEFQQQPEQCAEWAYDGIPF